MSVDAVQTRPTARKTDPPTSHDAGEAHAASGRRAAEQQRVLEALRQCLGGVTSDELADWAGLDRYMVARRLPELRDQRRLAYVAGYPEMPEKRRSAISNRKAMVWRATPVQPDLGLDR